MRYTLVILVAVAALLGVAPASAQLVAHHPAHATVRQIESSQKQNLKHARFLCNYGRNATRRWGCHARKWLKRELNETEAVLHPPVTASSHYQGWACITNGATPKSAHEGNGYNGLYTGWLGMTTPWAGHYPPGRDWVHSSQAAVYAIAEEVAALHHWDYYWMQGQWPRTFPPCAGYFR